MGDVLANLGLAPLWAGQARRGLDVLAQALAGLARAAADRFAEKTILEHLGNAASSLRDHGRAVTVFGEALVMARQFGDRLHEADLLWHRAIQFAELGQRDQALTEGQESVALFGRLGDPNAGSFAAALDQYRAGPADGGLATPPVSAMFGGSSSLAVRGVARAGGGPAPAEDDPVGRQVDGQVRRVGDEDGSGRHPADSPADPRRLPSITGVRCRLCGCFTASTPTAPRAGFRPAGGRSDPSGAPSRYSFDTQHAPHGAPPATESPMTRSWFRKLFDRKTRTLSAGDRVRPVLEALEDRLAPAIVSFTPTGTGTVGQSTYLAWDMESGATAVGSGNDSTYEFTLTDHGDIHHTSADTMVVTSGTAGAKLPMGTIIGPGSTYSGDGFTGTTGFGGTFAPPERAFMGLRFDIGGNTHYGWVDVEEGTSSQTLHRWAYETTPNTPIAAGVLVAAPSLDFGNAQPVYPTLLASNGARHTVVSGFSLGPTIDEEADGQPNATATGDDQLLTSGYVTGTPAFNFTEIGATGTFVSLLDDEMSCHSARLHLQLLRHQLHGHLRQLQRLPDRPAGAVQWLLPAARRSRQRATPTASSPAGGKT